MIPSGRICVVFAATIVVALGAVQNAQAQDPSPPPPPPAAADEPPAGDPPPAPAPAPDPQPEPPTPEPAPPEPAAGGDPAATDGAAAAAPTPPASAPPATGDPAAVSTGSPAAEAPAATPEDIVTLEDAAAPTAAPAAPAAPAEPPAAAAAHVAAPAPEAATVTIVLVVELSAAEPDAATADPAADTAAAAAAADDTAPAVRLGPNRESSTVALLADDYAAVATTKPATAAVPAAPLTGSIQPTCSRPRARVPLSQRCKQARAAAVLPTTLVYAPSLQVRAAINRIAARLTTARRVESRAPPDSKAAKKEKHPVAVARPMIPFGYSGQGDARDAFGGSSGSGWSSRLFALAAVPLRVPLPHRFARLRLPSTIPHGVIAAPPTARPG